MSALVDRGFLIVLLLRFLDDELRLGQVGGGAEGLWRKFRICASSVSKEVIACVSGVCGALWLCMWDSRRL